MQYIMPNVECKRCTLQWYYQTGNSPRAYPEEFWNCADIQVTTGALSLTPKAFEASEFQEQQLFDQTLGGCGISGTENGQKCFSIDIRVTDQWCDKVRCSSGFTWDGNGRPGDGHMCMWVDVDDGCAPISIPPQVSNRQNLAMQPTPAPWSPGNNDWGADTDNEGNMQGGGQRDTDYISTRDFDFDYSSSSSSNFDYNWASHYTGGSAHPSSQVSGGGSGMKTISTSTTTTSSTFH